MRLRGFIIVAVGIYRATQLGQKDMRAIYTREISASVEVLIDGIAQTISTKAKTNSCASLTLRHDGGDRYRLLLVNVTRDLELHSWSVKVGAHEKWKTIFEPIGFGALHACDASCSFSNPFPAMQYVAGFLKNGIGVYLASEDPKATIKSISGTESVLRIYGPAQRKKIHAAGNTGVEVVSFPFRISILPPNSNWLTAAEYYRDWVHSSTAAWVNRARTEKTIESIQLWVNTHWQEYDVLNKSGGSPDTVRTGVEDLMTLVGDVIEPGDLAVHWYEWDRLGFLEDDYSHCDNSVRCGFDSHYPEYSPERQGFNETVDHLHSIGVKVVPYINGRLYDTNVHSWSVIKRSSAKQSDQTPYIENYGNGVNFAVMCPTTNHWQRTLQNVTSQLFDLFSVDGIYIDEVAAAAPSACHDQEHGHSIGGGAYWTEGYQELLDRTRMSKKFIATESNVEQFIGYVDGFLALVAIGVEGENSQIVPAFQAIYGGSFTAFGAVFHREDLKSGRFKKVIALQFLLGVQLGWFSLFGSSNSSGFPIGGLLEELKLPQYSSDLRFLKDLIVARKHPIVSKFLINGRAGMRFPKDWTQVWFLEGFALVLSVNPLGQPIQLSSELHEALRLYREVPKTSEHGETFVSDSKLSREVPPFKAVYRLFRTLATQTN